MTEPRPKTIPELIADHELIGEALSRATREALLVHARAGRSVPVSRDGQVVWLTPVEIFARYGESPAPAPKQAS